MIQTWSLAALLLLAPDPAATAAPAARRPAPTAMVSAQERQAAESLRAETLRAHIRFLAHDLLEGRGPGSRGDRLAQAYIAAQLEGLGLEPGAPGGSWFQPFDIVGMTTSLLGSVRVSKGAQSLTLEPGPEFVAVPGQQRPELRLDQAELVFVGYGIVAPEFGWDDFKGENLAGKVLVVMNNDPAGDPRLFAGDTRLYYGRWDYKYESAARTGAAGAIIIHTRASAGYPWQVVQNSWGGETYALPEGPGPHLLVNGWATEEACRRIAQLGGHDLDALRAAAERRDFKPVPLGVTIDLTLKTELRRTQTANVIGRLPGSDALVAQEAVLYTAHHDHLGIKAPKGEADTIYNGAVDNASGVAMLLNLARAARALPTAPRRSLLFAAVAAEEQGLLGSRYLAEHLPLESGRLLADINVDGLNLLGRTRDVVAIGQGKSSLDDYVQALARMQERTLVADPFPDRGSFYRSDQLSFARLGVPSAYVKSGTDVIGKPAGWGKEQREKFESSDYHQPSDELRPDWDYSGALEDGRLLFYLGLKVANAAKKPAWKPGDEFEAARKVALERIGE